MREGLFGPSLLLYIGLGGDTMKEVFKEVKTSASRPTKKARLGRKTREKDEKAQKDSNWKRG